MSDRGVYQVVNVRMAETGKLLLSYVRRYTSGVWEEVACGSEAAMAAAYRGLSRNSLVVVREHRRSSSGDASYAYVTRINQEGRS